ncbi:MAG TPA: hypothetical protein VGC35_14380 [Allosphingosinicella sp.]
MRFSKTFGARARAFGVAIAGAILLGGCAASSSYAGISFKPGAAEPALEQLARRARAGDKQAQLELGVRYEEGTGVARDLKRARDLYFDAATRRSKRQTAVYLPRKGGGGSVKLFPGDLEFSGNEEALLRWQRLAAHLSRPSAASPVRTSKPPVSPSAAQAIPAPAYREEYADAAYQELIGFNAYQPLFNGLKNQSMPWRQAILEEQGARFATARTLQDTFLFILNRPSGVEPGVKADPAAARFFCAETLRLGSTDAVGRRLAGLCALQDCRSTGSPAWEAVVRSLAKPASPAAKRADRQRDFHDAAFLLRVAGACGRPAAARDLEGRLISDSAYFDRLLDESRSQGAGPNAELAIWRARLGGDMQILLAAGESEAVPAQLARAAARTWLTSGLPAPLPRGEIDQEVAQLCKIAEVAPEDCRVQFPHSFFLEQHYFQAAASVIATGGSSDFCPAIRMFRARFSREIDFRFSTSGADHASLRFAPRCFPLDKLNGR